MSLNKQIAAVEIALENARQAQYLAYFHACRDGARWPDFEAARAARLELEMKLIALQRAVKPKVRDAG